jgi:hypothetical protein
MGLICLLSVVAYFFGLGFPTFPNVEFIVAVGFLVILPLIIYMQGKRNFKTNTRLNEEMKYIFTDDKFYITGESFKSEMTWEKAYKIEELKNWILIYQNWQVANIIPKSAFSDEQLNDFRQIISKYKPLAK